MFARFKIFLSEQDAYTLHKPARVHFKRNRVFVTKPLKQFQADLCDIRHLSEYNDGFNYLLTVTDVFSKKAYVCDLKKKTGSEVTEAFESVLRESQIPENLQTDVGKEFFKQEFSGSDEKSQHHSVCHRQRLKGLCGGEV